MHDKVWNGETMRRREFMTLVGGAVASWPLTAFGKTPRIAIVLPSFPVSKMTETGHLEFKAFFDELGRLGYVEGANLFIERYSGEGRAAHYAGLARDVVSSKPDVIIAFVNDLVLDFKATTTTIPIVGLFGNPVESGIVASLARPGGNITGVTMSSGTSGINCCGSWCHSWPSWRYSTRDDIETYGKPGCPSLVGDGQSLMLAPRSIIR
jgi:putative ABC transport system substrate-binding protein